MWLLFSCFFLQFNILIVFDGIILMIWVVKSDKLLYNNDDMQMSLLYSYFVIYKQFFYPITL